MCIRDSKYIGAWKDDKKHGQGTYIHADGTQETGEWKDGQLVNRF